MIDKVSGLKLNKRTHEHELKKSNNWRRTVTSFCLLLVCCWKVWFPLIAVSLLKAAWNKWHSLIFRLQHKSEQLLQGLVLWLTSFIGTSYSCSRCLLFMASWQLQSSCISQWLIFWCLQICHHVLQATLLISLPPKWWVGVWMLLWTECWF